MWPNVRLLNKNAQLCEFQLILVWFSLFYYYFRARLPYPRGMNKSSLCHQGVGQRGQKDFCCESPFKLLGLQPFLLENQIPCMTLSKLLVSVLCPHFLEILELQLMFSLPLLPATSVTTHLFVLYHSLHMLLLSTLHIIYHSELWLICLVLWTSSDCIHTCS